MKAIIDIGELGAGGLFRHPAWKHCLTVLSGAADNVSLATFMSRNAVRRAFGPSAEAIEWRPLEPGGRFIGCRLSIRSPEFWHRLAEEVRFHPEDGIAALTFFQGDEELADLEVEDMTNYLIFHYLPSLPSAIRVLTREDLDPRLRNWFDRLAKGETCVLVLVDAASDGYPAESAEREYRNATDAGKSGL